MKEVMNEQSILVKETIELSHMALSNSISNFAAELKTNNKKLDALTEKVDELDIKVDELAPVLKQYNDNKTIENNDKKRGLLIVKWAGALIAIGSAALMIQSFFKWIVK